MSPTICCHLPINTVFTVSFSPRYDWEK